MTYKPRAIDSSNVRLDSRIQALVELLAENNHENWALQRIKEGWSYGIERNDEAKTHPDLVPYEDLPESSTIGLGDFEGYHGAWVSDHQIRVTSTLRGTAIRLSSLACG